RPRPATPERGEGLAVLLHGGGARSETEQGGGRRGRLEVRSELSRPAARGGGAPPRRGPGRGGALSGARRGRRVERPRARADVVRVVGDRGHRPPALERVTDL